MKKTAALLATTFRIAVPASPELRQALAAALAQPQTPDP